MSAIVNGIINSTVGLLCSKLRDYTAERLDEGDVIDTQFRQIVVREIDDIKSKLDGLSRKDLLASLSFFKEGVSMLYISLETSGESRDQHSTSKAHLEDEPEVEGATATRVEQFSVTRAERDVVENAIELSKVIGNLKIASQERYKSAKESLKEARRLATEAFNNAALSTEDRLMASKLRITSRVLECLEDPQAAVHGGLLYLKELQDLPSVQAIFSVWKDSDKGITSRLRARFYKEQRNVTIESIHMINELLLDLAMKFTNIKMGLLNWPTIKTGKIFYHPLLDDPALTQKIEENKTQVPWFRTCSAHMDYYFRACALTSKGEILVKTGQCRPEIIRISGEHDLFCTFPEEYVQKEIPGFAVDENDNVYIVFKIPPSENDYPLYKLLTLDANGNVKAERFLDIITRQKYFLQVSVTKDARIVIYSNQKNTMYICDTTNTRQDYKFRLPVKDINHVKIFKLRFTVSNKNEIICTFLKMGEEKLFFMYIITMDGKLKHALQLPVTIQSRYVGYCLLSVAFNHVDEMIFVSFQTHDKPYTTIFNLTNTGKLICQFNILDLNLELISHPKGPIALVGRNKAFLLQM